MRVYSVKKAQKEHKCARGCTIRVGESYRYITPRFGPQRNFCTKHPPRPSDLAGGKLADAYAAQESLEDDLNAFTNGKLDIDGLRSSIEEAASEAERIAEEYEESISNMPDALQESPVAEECRERAEALQEWAQELQGLNLEDEPEADEMRREGLEECETDEEKQEALEEIEEEEESAVEEWREQVSSEVESVLSSLSI